MLTRFKHKIFAQKGAVEFIESSVVFAFIMISITILLLISLITVRKTVSREIYFDEAIKKIYSQGDVNLQNRIRNINNDNNLKTNLTVEEGIIFKKVLINDSQVLKRIDFGPFVRKIDIAKDLTDSIKTLEIKDKSLNSILDSYRRAIDKIRGIL